jgi:sulfoxide reductase heme-binding subunit YedZ
VRLSGRTLVVLIGVVALLAIVTSDQVVPATTAYQAQMRIWLVARATGITAYLLLSLLVTLGLILSHPVNQSTWRLSKRLFPWHENLFVFVVAFVGVHIASLVLDPYAGVGLGGAFLPGASGYRSVPTALGTLALYALLVTALTARYTRLLPAGAWLRIHRVSLVVFALAWTHGVLAGTDSDALRLLYVVTGGLVVVAAAYRYWVGRQRRPSFATSLPEDRPGSAGPARPAPRASSARAEAAAPPAARPEAADRRPEAAAPPAARPEAADRRPEAAHPRVARPMSGLVPVPGLLATLRGARRIDGGAWAARIALPPEPRPPATDADRRSRP